jgi:hypothetical protein
MPSGSLVRIVAFWRRATVTTTASTTSAVLVKRPPCLVRFALAQRNDHAPSQETPELDLLWGAADLGDNGRRNQVFLSGEEAADVFRKAGGFYLWEGRLIGEALVVP